MSQAYRTRPSSLVGVAGDSWLAYQLDAAVMSFADDWAVERDRAMGDGGRGSDARVEQAFRRFIDGTHRGHSRSGWVAQARAASEAAKREAAARAAGKEATT